MSFLFIFIECLSVIDDLTFVKIIFYLFATQSSRAFIAAIRSEPKWQMDVAFIFVKQYNKQNLTEEDALLTKPRTMNVRRERKNRSM